MAVATFAIFADYFIVCLHIVKYFRSVKTKLCFIRLFPGCGRDTSRNKKQAAFFSKSLGCL